jgi:hypothetical protein
VKKTQKKVKSGKVGVNEIRKALAVVLNSSVVQNCNSLNTEFSLGDLVAVSTGREEWTWESTEESFGKVIAFIVCEFSPISHIVLLM